MQHFFYSLAVRPGCDHVLGWHIVFLCLFLSSLAFVKQFRPSNQYKTRVVFVISGNYCGEDQTVWQISAEQSRRHDVMRS